ncbi:MAG: FtsW/RodA/SpoVE family cell cycle protein [Ruminococcus sp.]
MPDLLEWGVTGAAVIAVFLAAESYRLERLAIWRNPEKYEKGFQTIQGLYAIGSGGLFGRGFGSSLQKLGFVPEAQNDMIFSIICEELGLTGSLLSHCHIRAAYLETDGDCHSLHRNCSGNTSGVGIMGHMAIQVILNIAVVTNTIPNTGITLPLYQLWRNFSGVSSGRDGAGFERKQKMKFYHQSEIFAYNKR